MTPTDRCETMSTIRTIITEYLTAHGFDGLCNADAECGCLADDLAPCNEPGLECCAGYRSLCDCGDHDYHVVAHKPEDPPLEVKP